ncbi:phosphatase and actin regulator 2-like [Bombyx mandarina]|uniref:Phosphatase and actin regulator 2-like n=1 Tax=Bombyx mandarina TaxID=7092 RepID=A0A6J2KNH4_BOMMA|nr:phosphatase and actin regulator 2-like [Bombyx mandarina]
MGVTAPPPLPPVPRPRVNPVPIPTAAPLPIPQGKGKGKGKSSLPPSQPTLLPTNVEAHTAAATLMAEDNPPRPSTSTAPVPRAPAVASSKQVRTTGGKAARNAKKNKNKKIKKKEKKLAARAQEQALQTQATGSTSTAQSKPQKEAPQQMEVEYVEPEEAVASTSSTSRPIKVSIEKPQDPTTSGPNIHSLPPRPQRERRSGRQAQPAGFAAWLLALWEKLSEVISGVIREIASGASPFGALLSGFYRMIARFNG